MVVIFSSSWRQRKKRKNENPAGWQNTREKLLSEWCHIWIEFGWEFQSRFYYSDCVFHLNDVIIRAVSKNTVILCLERLSFIYFNKTETGAWEGHFSRLIMMLVTTEKSENFSNFLCPRSTKEPHLFPIRAKNSLYKVLSYQLVCFRFPGGLLKDSTPFFLYIMKLMPPKDLYGKLLGSLKTNHIQTCITYTVHKCFI